MVIELGKLIKIEDFLDPANIDKFRKAMAVVQKAQNNIAALKENDNPEKMNILKVGTTLTMAIFNKVQEGKLPTDFTTEDWEYVVDYISEYAVEADEAQYSAYVFMMYAWFIETSVEQMSLKLAETKQAAILALSDELKLKTELLSKGELNEVNYVEECLWICLEAMIKLLSGTIDTALGFDKNQVVEAAAVLGMEYARFVLYKRENDLVTEYLNNQKILDVELAMKYDKYIEELNEQVIQFESFIDAAFDPGFGEMLTNSVNLARASGVDESEILKSTQDIDDYFM